MKKIKAYFKKHKFNSVVTELNKISSHGGIGGISSYETLGFGKGKAINVDNTITYETNSLIPSICIEIFCKDEVVDETVKAIQKAAHTGMKGDGKIFITSIVDAIRIRDGKNGEEVL